MNIFQKLRHKLFGTQYCGFIYGFKAICKPIKTDVLGRKMIRVGFEQLTIEELKANCGYPRMFKMLTPTNEKNNLD